MLLILTGTSSDIRHGLFTVEAPDVGGVIVYKATTSSGTGYFNDDERLAFLDKAKAALSDFYNSVHTI